MYKDSKRTCKAIVLLSKPFVWRRSRCRRRRGLLKLPNCFTGGRQGNVQRVITHVHSCCRFCLFSDVRCRGKLPIVSY